MIHPPEKNRSASILFALALLPALSFTTKSSATESTFDYALDEVAPSLVQIS